jgi:PAS domain S-box-containing protein
MPAGVIVSNSKEKFVFGNRRMAEILGFSEAGAESIDFSEWDLRDSGNRQLGPADMPMARAIRKGETLVSEEMYLLHPENETTVVSVNAAPIIGEEGEIVGGVLAFEDITRRVNVETALRKSEERLRLMSESFTDYAIFTSDVEGRVLSWNTGAARIFGYSGEEIIGKSAAYMFTPVDREEHVPESEMKVARETGRASDERWHLRKDNTRFYASGVMAPLFDEGVLVGYAKIARDLTEAKKIEEELYSYRSQLESLVEERTAALEESNTSLRQEMLDRQQAEDERVGLLRRIVTTQEEERSRIARDMHDQLGQQLTALRLKIATLADNYSIGPRLAKEIEALQDAAARLDEEVGFLAWELRPAALDDLGFVAATRNFVAEWSRHYSIGAELHAGNLEGQRLPSEIETNLYRIAQEALNNIYKHAQARNVNIVVERRKDAMVLIIEDDGIGFDPENVRPNKESGIGLGLVGMRERAAIVGGTLEIESAPGKGTTIFVRVPLSERESERGRLTTLNQKRTSTSR